MATLPRTKAQIISAVAEKADITKEQARAAIEGLLEIAFTGARKEEDFTIPGLGKLVVTDRKARMGRNPRTGEQMMFPAKKVVKLRLGKAAKDAIIPPKA